MQLRQPQRHRGVLVGMQLLLPTQMVLNDETVPRRLVRIVVSYYVDLATMLVSDNHVQLFKVSQCVIQCEYNSLALPSRPSRIRCNKLDRYADYVDYFSRTGKTSSRF